MENIVELMVRLYKYDKIKVIWKNIMIMDDKGRYQKNVTLSMLKVFFKV